MANLEVINKEDLPLPTALSTSTWIIYDDVPPTIFQGSPMEACDEIEVEDVYVNIVYTFQPNLFSVLSE